DGRRWAYWRHSLRLRSSFLIRGYSLRPSKQNSAPVDHMGKGWELTSEVFASSDMMFRQSCEMLTSLLRRVKWLSIPLKHAVLMMPAYRHYHWVRLCWRRT